MIGSVSSPRGMTPHRGPIRSAEHREDSGTRALRRRPRTRTPRPARRGTDTAGPAGRGGSAPVRGRIPHAAGGRPRPGAAWREHELDPPGQASLEGRRNGPRTPAARTGLTTEWQYRTHFVELGRLGYRKSEPHSGVARETSGAGQGIHCPTHRGDAACRRGSRASSPACRSQRPDLRARCHRAGGRGATAQRWAQPAAAVRGPLTCRRRDRGSHLRPSRRPRRGPHT